MGEELLTGVLRLWGNLRIRKPYIQELLDTLHKEFHYDSSLLHTPHKEVPSLKQSGPTQTPFQEVAQLLDHHLALRGESSLKS